MEGKNRFTKSEWCHTSHFSLLSHHVPMVQANLCNIESDHSAIYVKWDETKRSPCFYRIKCKGTISLITLPPVPCLISWISLQETKTIYNVARIFLVLEYLRKSLALCWHITLDSGYFWEGKREWRNHVILYIFTAWIFYKRNSSIT